jgi:nucleotide-binding universal stress UspA family protein
VRRSRRGHHRHRVDTTRPSAIAPPVLHEETACGQEDRPMFQKILVPVDLADVHQGALDIAARLAQANGGEVTLLHVVEVISEVWATEDREFYTRLEQKARDHLARLGHALEAHGVPRREAVVFGPRVPEIVRYAGEVGAELIVLKSHRIDLENPSAGWGTVSYKVGILAQCPVLLVK